MPTPAILLTRPETQAGDFAETLRSRLGFDGEICLTPLLGIEPTEALPDLTGITGLIFTSKHGVERFAAVSNRRDLPCWCVGGATGKAAEEAGLRPTVAEGDASALIRRILADAPPGPLLHLRGEQARGDVSEKLSAEGIETRSCVLYRQVPLALAERAKILLKRENPVILPLFSPNTAGCFAGQAPFTAPLYIAAISENVAAEVRGLSPARLDVAETPNADAMLEAMAALIDACVAIEGGSSNE